ncbi:MAG: hypothetical protein ACKO0Z_27795, partial [Betaproteobacteria bacterium]
MENERLLIGATQLSVVLTDYILFAVRCLEPPNATVKRAARKDMENTTDVGAAPVDAVVIQPTFVSLDQEVIRRAIECCETAIENTAECLAVHDATLGRTTRKNKWIAEKHE